ncbi:uncharacterized protein CC84DRAFT_1009733 [Paraphaeosphaeria sporulosa]|uniref:Uncharacterized protein n=1 Tax=Paraphaeosphaeria sporulosa TaxID=1460663 RepID=A0A177C4K4_9PLEO|nr:uncharacterized protein CC84DRAFT_1009733 [Paraphaeosphaeria sporulosa]OAG02346.1 hypothetical protein CC84DRAFT_1009733 [Paraphaeosphaeria sporulosa]
MHNSNAIKRRIHATICFQTKHATPNQTEPPTAIVETTRTLPRPLISVNMRTTALLTTALSAALTTARLTGLAAPSTLAPSSPFNLTLITENYIQSVADVSIAWGFSLAPGYPLTLGSFTSSSYLGPDKSNQLENVTIAATAPAELEEWKGKEVVLAGSLFSLYGASGSPSLTNFNVTILVGDETSEELIRSD